MASPSAEGLSKDEIKRRLAQMKRQYEQMQRKLDKSEKAARAKSHVKKKIEDYKLKQARDGSPECTLQKAAHRKHAGDCTGSPSLPADSRGRLSSEPHISNSGKKKGKRRSVSFVLVKNPAPTLGEQDALCKKQEATPKLQVEKFKKVRPRRDPRMSPTKQYKEKSTTAVCTTSTPVPELNKDVQSTVCENRIISESSTGILAHVQNLNECMELMKSDDIPGNKVKTNQLQSEEYAHRATEQVLQASPSVKTPPEDTQFDLFADTYSQDESLQVIEVSLDSGDSDGKVTRVKMVTVDASLEVSPCGERLKPPNDTRKFIDGRPIAINQWSTSKELDDSVKVVILDDTERDMLLMQTPKKFDGDDCIDHSKNSVLKWTDGDDHSLKRSKDFHHKEDNEQSDVSHPDETVGTLQITRTNSGDVACSDHNDIACSVLDKDFMEDPDIIPSTFSEDRGTVKGSIPVVSGRKLISGRSAIMSNPPSNCDVDRSTHKKSSPSQAELIKETTVKESSKGLVTPDKINSQNGMERVQSSQEIEATALKQDENRKENCRKSENEQSEQSYDLTRTELVTRDCDQHDADSGSTDSQEILMNYQGQDSQGGTNSQKVCGKTNAQKNRRRRRQRNINNLSMDDISLKDFVLSQQNSQEGNHTWIDGLMYPAEYYVRKTRSMSKHSPTLHSAPIPGTESTLQTTSIRRGSLSKECDGRACSEPFVHIASHEFTAVEMKDDKDYVQVDKEEPSCTHGLDSSDQQTKGHAEGPVGKGDGSQYFLPLRKMRVSRKPAARKKRGRKSSSKMCNKDEQLLGTIEARPNDALQGIVKGQNICLDKSQLIDATSAQRNKTLASPCKEGPAEAASQEMAGHDHSQQILTASVDQSTADRRTNKPTKSVLNTQLTQNPLESQFTQTLIPEDFVLPQVFSSPGHPTQGLVGLTPGSPSSSSLNMPSNALGSPVRYPRSSQHGCVDRITSERNLNGDLQDQAPNDHQNQGCNDQGWMSAAYLADVVPEFPADPDINHLNNAEECIATIKGFDVIDEEPGHVQSSQNRIDVPSSLQKDLDAKSQVSDVSMVSVSQDIAKVDKEPNHSQESQDLIPEVTPFLSSSQCDDMVKPLCGHSKDKLAPDLCDCNERDLDYILEGTDPVPSSLHSNVDRRSPYANAATGTPPETAEIPQAQSQCSDSYRARHDGSQGGRMADGDMAVNRTDCFQFKGCLEHGPSTIRGITSSEVILSGVKKPVLAVQCFDEIFFWTSTSLDHKSGFSLLCSWKTCEKVISIQLVPGMVDVIEAVIAVEHEDRSQSVRYIRWDCQEGGWEGDIVLSSEDMHQQPCSSLCALHNRRVAVGVNNETFGSEVRVIDLCPEDGQRQGSAVQYLPASKERLNSLTAIDGASDMLLGMADSAALLWHIPSQQLLQGFRLGDQGVNHCIQATAESGLLFVVAYHKKYDLEGRKLVDCDSPPSCNLLALNPVNGKSSKLLDYDAPCIQTGVEIEDASVYSSTLAACMPSGHICLWDLYSSQLLLAAEGRAEQNVTSLCLQDTRTLLLGSEHCVNVYDKVF